jgi:sulfofructose kinase
MTRDNGLHEMQSSFHVLGLGCAALDELLYVEEFPLPDVKTRVIRREQQCGGLTGTALVAASRLGARCAYAGRLGIDSASQLIAENFVREGVDISLAPRGEEFGVVHSTIIVGAKTGTRNVFSLSQGRIGAHENLPAAEVIGASRVLFVDHHGVPGAIRAAKIARAAGVAVVADFERDDSPRFFELLELMDHLIISESVARRITNSETAVDAVLILTESAPRSAVIVTSGEHGCWYAGNNDPPCHAPAFKVNIVDTTGCGDVFHGAYAAALAFEMSLPERVRFASAAAAIKATRHGGQRGIPRRAELDQFLKKAATTAPVEKSDEQ